MKDSFHNSIWAIRDARIALLARALSTAGTAVTSIAAILLLHGLGVGPFGIAAFLAALALPTIATMGLAGRIADTVDSRIVLTVTALVQAAACFVLGAFPEAGTIYATGFVIACAQAFAQPSWQALLPRVVGDERIGAAVAWQQGLNAVAAPVGAALGGILVSSGHVSWGFWLDGASYLLLALAACAIRERRHGGERAAAGSSWTAGIRIVARDRMVWPLFVAILVFQAHTSINRSGNSFASSSARGRCCASTAPTPSTAAIIPSATRPCRISASSACMASPHTSGATRAAMASSAMISARCSAIDR